MCLIPINIFRKFKQQKIRLRLTLIASNGVNSYHKILVLRTTLGAGGEKARAVSAAMAAETALVEGCHIKGCDETPKDRI
jgi:hypothetical protein